MSESILGSTQQINSYRTKSTTRENTFDDHDSEDGEADNNRPSRRVEVNVTEMPTVGKSDSHDIRKQSLFSISSSRPLRARAQRRGGARDRSIEVDGNNDDDGGEHEKGSRTKLLWATSAALTRFKGMTIRSATSGKVLTPRSVAPVAGTSSTKSRKMDKEGEQSHPHRGSTSKNRESGIRGSDEMVPSSLRLKLPVPTAGNESTPKADLLTVEGKMTAMFDGSDDDESRGGEERGGGRERIKDLDQCEEEYTASPRANWAATLVASTLARAKSTAKKTSVGDRANLLPHPRDSGNKVDYLIMVCKASEAYASSQATKVTRVRDGQHMINQLQDVTSDLSRQREKILAVYDAREVQRSADRLGETLKAVCDLVGDLESTAVMFGKKRGFGKTVSALVHDIGTNANALLAATSLAIADRPNVLYMTDAGAGEPPAPQQEELVKMCIKGDKFFFGRAEKPSLRKAYEAYSWAAERGCAEAMYMSAWMYRAGAYVEIDPEKCQFWLENAVDKGYAPAMNDLAVILLTEADQVEAAHPEVKADDAEPARFGAPGSDGGGSSGVDMPHGEGDEGYVDEGLRMAKIYEGRRANEAGDDGGGESEEVEGLDGGSGRGTETSLPSEQAQMFEQVMARRKKAMQLLQEAAKAGHTDAMTNLGNMQEAMGYLEEARIWYSLAAEPSESANNPRAQNYLGTLYYEGRGVARDLPEAAKWFQRGARQGNAQACQNLGTCYQAGLGVPKDTPKAIELFRRAVERGSISAMNNLAYMLARDALHTLAAVARQAPQGVDGFVGGLSFENPSKGLMQTGDISINASSQALKETTAQLREAADLFRRAADNGVADASYQLGRLYQQGLGIPLDPVAAFENFLAAANGSMVHPNAAACVGDMLYTGTGCLRDYTEAIRYYLRAAHAGQSTSANAVGLMYELGRGVMRNISTAGQWYARAAELGSADGAFNAALLLERGDPLSAFAVVARPFSPRFGHTNTSSPSRSASSPHTTAPVTRGTNKRRDSGDFSSGSSSADDGEYRRVDIVEDFRTTSRDHKCQHHRDQQHAPQQRSLNDLKDSVQTDNTRRKYERRQRRRERRPYRQRGRRRRQRQSPLSVWGDRAAAIEMFERARALGHPGAEGEVHRLRLRERMDSLVQARPSAEAVADVTAPQEVSVGIGGVNAPHCCSGPTVDMESAAAWDRLL